MTKTRRKRPVADRFWEKVEKTDSCWLWQAATNSKGYGQFKVAGRLANAHRVAYELAKGPIPEGLTLDHLCRVRHCVNPDHLEAVTNRENILRGTGITARMVRKTHCAQGHPFDEANTGRQKHGRRCKACKAIQQRRRRERLGGAS